MSDILYVVIPCYNEEAVIQETVSRLSGKIEDLMERDMISRESRIMLVNDGSKDRTWEIIEALYGSSPYVTGVSLSKNRGHQNALLAGLMTAKEHADMVISMDADLQDDINVMDDFLREYYQGAQIVYGVRSSRKADTFLKKNTALLFYRLMKGLGVDLVYNHADYRLMSRRVIEELAGYREANLFLRGIVPMIGFQNAVVEYERHERFAGESKYPLGKMLSFAVEGITSCSVKPLRIITVLGFLLSLMSFLYLIYVVIGHFAGQTISGWTTQIVLISFFGGFQILCMGIIGEYVGKIYSEVKQRPRFIVERALLK